jgi:60 kDa SS-A/Ro ribonucleoprotein
MATINVPSRTRGGVRPARTYEGALSKRVSPETELRRAVLTSLLWEDSFYESGNETAARIAEAIKQVSPEKVSALAVEAREKMKLRHMPLWIVRVMAQLEPAYRRYVADTLERVIQRPDELTEFLAIYWKDKKQPLSAQVKKGLARAFAKFNTFQLSRYNRDGAVKLRDVMFLTHPNPNGLNRHEGITDFYTKLANKEALPTVDTWETELSAGKDKKATFTRLIHEGKLGGLALLRNLRNMQQAGVEEQLIKDAIVNMRTDRILPFRFITAAQYAPKFETKLEMAMFRCLEGQPKLSGKTALVIDTSPSMWGENVSAKSELTRIDAACALAILIRELAEDVAVYCFNENGKVHEVPDRRGFALRDAIHKTKGGSSFGAQAVVKANKDGYDRVVVLTDGEWHGDPCPAPLADKAAYYIALHRYKNQVSFGKDWLEIAGWSEAILEFMQVAEAENLQD